MHQSTSSLGEVHSAYLAETARASGASTWRLRGRIRQWERRRQRLDAATLARLRAVHHELADRT